MFYFEKKDFWWLNSYSDPPGPRLRPTQLGIHYWILKLRQVTLKAIFFLRLKSPVARL
jgi:hypothetical protein